MFQTPVLTPDGKFAISQKNDSKVWALMFELLEERMKRGELTVIDACHSKSSDFKKYKELCQNYRYRAYCVDFSDVPMEKCIEQNKKRADFKQVPESVIENMYARFRNFAPQAWIEIIKPDQFSDIFRQFAPLDLTSKYKKIHHIGDLHGCNTVLQEYLKDGLKDDELYIFIGDFVDRGIENGELLRFLVSIIDKPNVMMLEGNHEIHLWDWANDLNPKEPMKYKSPEFENVTKPELESKGIDKKDVRMLYRKLIQLAYYKFGNKYVLVTHGGISTIPGLQTTVVPNNWTEVNNLKFIATSQFIKGTGRYEDAKLTDDTFLVANPDNFYSIHGHRNVENLLIQVNARCWNLEGKVEFGGHLRVVTLDSDGFHNIEVKNNVFNPIPEKKVVDLTIKPQTNIEFIESLRANNKSINEKAQGGNISSFNFNRKVFYSKEWNDMTIRARGLFINTETGEVVARAYEKFFNIEERQETWITNLQRTMRFPAKAWVKENGYLGLVGYDSASDSLFISSKSSATSDFSAWFKDMLYNKYKINEVALKSYLKDTNTCLVFESIDPVNDPHIIKYLAREVVLLDIIRRSMVFERLPMEETVKMGTQWGFRVKVLGATFDKWEDFFAWYNTAMSEPVEVPSVEGYVIEDAVGFQVKIKMPYYKFYKGMRTIKDMVGQGKKHMVRQSSLTTPLANDFFGWLTKQSKEDLQKDIIYLRDKYYAEIEGNMRKS